MHQISRSSLDGFCLSIEFFANISRTDEKRLSTFIYAQKRKLVFHCSSPCCEWCLCHCTEIMMRFSMIINQIIFLQLLFELDKSCSEVIDGIPYILDIR